MEKSLYEIIGMKPIAQDEFIPNGKPRIVMCRREKTGEVFPVQLSGAQWDLCYWIWRLSDEFEDMNDSLAQILEELLSK